MFQSTRPRGRTRHPEFVSMTKYIVFQSTRPRGRTRRCIGQTTSVSSRFQSTRPRGRTRQPGKASEVDYRVSIHASSREDATLRHHKSEAETRFNPRVLAGGRDYIAECASYAESVSIHASSREDATNSKRAWNEPCIVSIHASSREDATSIPVCKIRFVFSFNPRVLAGGRDTKTA